MYAVGTTTFTPNILTWTNNGLNANLFIQGLTLENGKTYYVLMKSFSNLGFTSDMGSSNGIAVDLTQPSVDGELSIIKGQQSYIVSWPKGSAGVSGIVAYEIQERSDEKPVWKVIISTSAENKAITLGQPAGNERAISRGLRNSAVFYGKDPATYYYRMKVKNGAGKWSTYSNISRVVYDVVSNDVVSKAYNYPNPFDSRTQQTCIHYQLNADYDTTLEFYDVFGNKVNSMQFAAATTGGQFGANEVLWDGTDSGGKKVSTGVYFCYVRTQGQTIKDALNIKIAVVH
jgi:hypothetical protein